MATHSGKIIEIGDRLSGFIKLDNKKDEKLFFHSDHLKDVKFANLKVGDKLTFMIQETRNGPYAIEVTKVTTKVIKSVKAKSAKTTKPAKAAK